MKRLLTRLAAAGPVPVFAAVGAGARKAVEDLGLDARVALVDSPRHAHVLLLAGCYPAPFLRPALRVHDALPHPRATVWWPLRDPAGRLTEAIPRAQVVAPGADPVLLLTRVYQDLLAGRRTSEPPLQPDVPPHPWRGVGPYGQGGKGMTGGYPYGRPMAGRAPDRDGLELDQLPLRVGPFFPHLPPGLVLRTKLQGDVLQEITVGANPFGDRPDSNDEPVPIAEVERARARSHLRAVARLLRLQGLHALANRTLRLAAGLPPDAGSRIRNLANLLERGRLLHGSTAGVGVITPEMVQDRLRGPVARASGIAQDPRANQEPYRDLGFDAVIQRDGDARARWRQWLAEAAQSVELAERAGDRTIRPSAAAATEAAALLDLLPALLVGQEWGDAVTTLVSLDLDLEEAAATPRAYPAVA